MLNSKKLLIISCSVGSGHIRAAEALRMTCNKLYPNIEVLHIDLAHYLDGISRIYLVSFYNFFSYLLPLSYKILYYLTNSWLAQKIFRTLSPIIRIGSKDLLKIIKEYQPDFIIATHFLPSLLLPKDLGIPMDMVITDYHAHKLWLTPNIRNFFVATEEIKKELDGFSLNATASGIPIHPGFFQHKDIKTLKDKFNFNNDNPIILFMPTSKGKIKTVEAIDKILNYDFGQELNLVAVAGVNQKNFRDLQEAHNSYLLNQNKKNSFTLIQKTDSIDELMQISDMVIGKAGGLTVSEALCLQKPIIIINPIPGQEDYNASYLEKNNFGLRASTDSELIEKIQKLLEKNTPINKKSYPDPSKIILEKTFLNP